MATALVLVAAKVWALGLAVAKAQALVVVKVLALVPAQMP